MIPCERACSPSEASLLKAPRSLKELVTCRFSYFTNTSAPVRSESFGAGSMGVRKDLTGYCAACQLNISNGDAHAKPSTSGQCPGSDVVSVAARAGTTSEPKGRQYMIRAALDLALLRRTAAMLVGTSNPPHSRFTGQQGFVARISAMTDSGPRKIGVSIELKPHAYDPIVNPELFEGVLARRCIAFLIDVTIIAIPVLFAAMFIFIFGFITLGLGWALVRAAVARDRDLGDRLLRHDLRQRRRRPPSACGSWISRCAPGTGHRPISCWARCTRSSTGSRVSFLTPLVPAGRVLQRSTPAACTTCWSARS